MGDLKEINAAEAWASCWPAAGQHIVPKHRATPWKDNAVLYRGLFHVALDRAPAVNDGFTMVAVWPMSVLS